MGRLLLILATVPLVLTLGHDLYLHFNSISPQTGVVYLTSLGQLWQDNHVSSLGWLVEQVKDNPEQRELVKSILNTEAVLVTLCFALVFYVPILLISFFRLLSGAGSEQRRIDELESRKQRRF